MGAAGVVISGAAGRAVRLDLPDAPRLALWIVELNEPAFILARTPVWASQFAISAAPIELLPGYVPGEHTTTHRLAFSPLSQPYTWGDDRPVVSVAALASVNYTAADDVMAGQVVRALAGAVAAGILPVGGRHPRMAWHASAGAVAFALHQHRADDDERSLPWA